MIIAKELLEVTNETLRFFLNASVEREKNVACQHLLPTDEFSEFLRALHYFTDFSRVQGIDALTDTWKDLCPTSGARVVAFRRNLGHTSHGPS